MLGGALKKWSEFDGLTRIFLNKGNINNIGPIGKEEANQHTFDAKLGLANRKFRLEEKSVKEAEPSFSLKRLSTLGLLSSWRCKINYTQLLRVLCNTDERIYLLTQRNKSQFRAKDATFTQMFNHTKVGKVIHSNQINLTFLAKYLRASSPVLIWIMHNWFSFTNRT
jgi:hypothetical protein